MADTLEEQILIPSDAGALKGVLYAPSETPLGSVLFCNPLFEERKSSQRVMVECARALCDDGLMVLRFDYRGCGDSTGDFKDFNTTHWLADIRSAAKVLRERSGDAALTLLGLRLGANLAVGSALEGLNPKALILWEPIAEGNAYIEHELRRKVLREMVTFGTGRSSRQSSADLLAAGNSVDLDGYELTADLASSIRKLSLSEDLTSIDAPLVLTNITHGDEPSRDLAPIRALLTREKQFELIREQPFWNRIGLTEPTDLIQKTVSWIKNYK